MRSMGAVPVGTAPTALPRSPRSSPCIHRLRMMASDPRQPEASLNLRYPSDLSRRAREVLDILYRLDGATVADVLAELPGTRKYDAVRSVLGWLEEKGYVSRKRDQQRHLYLPVLPRAGMGCVVLRHVLITFFGGSLTSAVSTLIKVSTNIPSEAEVAALLLWTKSPLPSGAARAEGTGSGAVTSAVAADR
jgi:BlaI family transcriptional regulator, penicillinase repressor